jgi:hypothetical protein
VRNEGNINHFSWPIILHRILNGTLFLDWPWGVDRSKQQDHHGDKRIALINMTITRISDIGDSVFFTGREIAAFPANFPVPIPSFSGAQGRSDIAFPWPESIERELELYKAALE